MPGTLCLTFDNMGRAREIAEGSASAPDPLEPGLAVGYPRLLALLDELDLRGTFFIEGWNGLHHPERVQELVERGHEVGLHGWVHERFASLDKARAAQLLQDGTASLARLGIRAKGFRAPGGVRGAHTVELLASLGYRYDSSADSPDGHAGACDEPGLLAAGIAHIPWRAAMVDSIQYLRHPVRPRTPAELEARWLTEIDRAAEGSKALTLVIHAFVSGVDPQRFAAVRKVLSHARGRADLEVTTAGALAERVLARATAGSAG
jgi:peptidoglycan/xylan/chitin deacetylase (PgdA/CDA1 family)